jgi:hypothetical protein
MNLKSPKSPTVEPEAKVVVPEIPAKEQDSRGNDRAGQNDSSPDQPALETALEEGWKMEGVDD